jgi:hypothetical protein
MDNILETDLGADLELHPARIGVLGEVEEEECVPANNNTPGELTIIVRDRDPVRDFSSNQRYEICFTVASPTCADPCAPGFDGQCWVP